MTASSRTIARRTTITVAALFCLAALAGCGVKPAPTQAQGWDGSAAFWPQPPAEPHIQFLTDLNSAADVREKKSGGLASLIYGEEQQADKAINKPYGLAMWDGKVYVCDVRSIGMLVLDLKKHEARVMGATGANAIKKPVDVAVADEGTKYVVDLPRNAILLYDANERYAGTFGPTSPGEEFGPVGVAVSGNELFVADIKARLVRVLDRFSGHQIRTIGEPGNDDGQFAQPLSVAVDKDGFVWVSDVMRCRVQKFTKNGEFVLGFGQSGNKPGDFVRPKHLRAAADGSVYVVDASFNNVQAFDDEGKIMGYFGAAGPHPGAMDLPAGLAIVEGGVEYFAKYVHPAFQAERLILVSNQFGDHKISVYAAGRLKPGKTPADVMANAAAVTAGTQSGKPADFLMDVKLPGGTAASTQPSDNPHGPAGPSKESHVPANIRSGAGTNR